MRPCILTIAGSDSGAGAGIQADSRTIHALGGFALTAITAVTAQNGAGVQAWDPVRPGMLASQIKSVFEGYPVEAVKTGLLPGAEAVLAVARSLPADVPLVVDPVLGSTSGTRFLNTKGVKTLVSELFPLATLVTPNWPEAEALTGLKIRNAADARRAAEALVANEARAVLIKGGHGSADRVDDVLVTEDGVVVSFASLRIETPNTHGTGCALSAAIATGLGRGRPLVPAIEEARRFLATALMVGAEQEWRDKGPAFAG